MGPGVTALGARETAFAVSEAEGFRILKTLSL